MTVGELKQVLDSVPDHYDVFMDERVTEFTYGVVNSAEVKTVDFMEEPRGEILATGVVLVLSEE